VRPEAEAVVKTLTDAAVRKYAPGPARRRIRDALAKSLFLIIEPSGHKSWQMRFRRPDGKPGKLTLGPVDFSGTELADGPQIGQPLTLSAARQLAASVHRERALGHDPIGDHKARKHRARVEAINRDANTYAAAVRDYVEQYARNKTRNWLETARLLGLRYANDASSAPQPTKGGLAQCWADRDVRSIDGHDIWTVTDEGRRVGIPGIVARNRGMSEARARMLFVALSSLFGWLKKNRRVDVNPCAGESRPAQAEARDRTLTQDEIIWFWKATDEVGQPFGSIFKLLLLTGARLNEVAGMRRSELSANTATWSLPGARTKNGRAHVVPLPPPARSLIAAVPGANDLLFTTTGSTAPSGWSRAKHRLDECMLAVARKDRGRKATLQAFRLHDLRRTAVTGMAELGIRPDVIELVVNHVSGHRGGIAGVYNRSELLPERTAALQRWAAHVEALVSRRSADVVTLRPGGSS
jgi:integrase